MPALAKPELSLGCRWPGAEVYQLGPFGTAAKKLKEWELK